MFTVELGSSLPAEKKRVNWFRDFYLAKHEKRNIELRHLDENIAEFVQLNRALLFRDLLNGVNLMNETLTNVTSTLYGVGETLLLFSLLLYIKLFLFNSHTFKIFSKLSNNFT